MPNALVHDPTRTDRHQQMPEVRDVHTLQLEPLLISARQAAAMCGRSERTWRSWDCAHLVPRGVTIGRSRLWRIDELREWIAAGCPRRADWDLSKST